MAAFSIDNPLLFTFGILGNLISLTIYLAPVPTFYRIMKKKSTEEFQSVPYVVTLFSNVVWLYYAIIQSNETLLITINCFECLIEAIYISIYIAYASNKPRMRTLKMLLLLNFVGFGLILIITNCIVKGAERVQFLGWIGATLAVGTYIAPLSITKKVVRTKSVEFMPISLSIAIVVSAAVWLCYGLLLKDLLIVVPNTVGVIAGEVQITLYKIYKCKAETKEKLPITLNPKPNPTSDLHQICSSPRVQDLDIRIAKVDNVVPRIQPEERISMDPSN